MRARGTRWRRRGFMAPAAGKTGSSHDAWFAGYTSNLLCIVWVGNDDYTNMGKIEGSKAAAPIWAEFMKKAVALPQYSDTHDFSVPAGVQMVSIDRGNELAGGWRMFGAALTRRRFWMERLPMETCGHPSTRSPEYFFRRFLG